MRRLLARGAGLGPQPLLDRFLEHAKSILKHTVLAGELVGQQDLKGEPAGHLIAVLAASLDRLFHGAHGETTPPWPLSADQAAWARLAIIAVVVS